ncbi:MAG: DUF4406 domain-containing protein [Bacteroidaceae bacterium]|nr:DUF4406 domain-containing protein [Bacteroidaceae bacterium]
MNTIRKRAHAYAEAHQNKSNGISLMRAYVAGATDERKQIKVFISGKVSGLDRRTVLNNFITADRHLHALGYTSINPIHLCRYHWSWLRCMIVCLWHLTFCDRIYQLSNWRDSRGARIEYKWAKFLGKRFL